MDKTENNTSAIALSSQVHDTRYISFRNPEVDSLVPVQIIYGGFEHCDRDYYIDRAGFPVYLLEYVVAGKGDLVLGGEKYTLRGGCAYWYGPEISCHLVNDAEDPLIKYFLAFRCADGDLNQVYNLHRQFIGANRGGDQIKGLIDNLFKEAFLASPDSCRICCSYLDIILLKGARTEIMERHTRERAWQVFKKVKDYISDNYLELNRMEEISTAMGLDVSYISRLFKRYYHMTPYNFLMQKKMEYALDLLRLENLPVQEVAKLAGFDDPFHFSRVFKKFKGINPSEVRGGRN